MLFPDKFELLARDTIGSNFTALEFYTHGGTISLFYVINLVVLLMFKMLNSTSLCKCDRSNIFLKMKLRRRKGSEPEW